MPTDISKLRQNYSLQTLSVKDILHNPIEQFAKWFQEAMDSQILEPNAFTLATANKEGKPSARTLLLKGFDKEGFVFFTNYESRKAEDLLQNPKAAMLFTWLDLQRQIRIEGDIEKVSQEESEEYFQSRPRGSQIGAWSSPQSQSIESREVLESNQKMMEEKFSGLEKLPVPPFWGGYRVRPNWFEFWQGRESRLHDRIVYALQNGNWEIGRLAP
ncbi:MAG: pyridoxamine 5'-phosphate oxidase [Lewinellaceae bacterium]|nr:pyridoxamine 5'-phosphate oxidase [Saprospiraceae bacterium]MCB9343045.1 pyridoxamine 5'-phosphate oxidase [Lewinellaceae bacterium]